MMPGHFTDGDWGKSPVDDANVALFHHDEMGMVLIRIEAGELVQYRMSASEVEAKDYADWLDGQDFEFDEVDLDLN